MHIACATVSSSQHVNMKSCALMCTPIAGDGAGAHDQQDDDSDAGGAHLLINAVNDVCGGETGTAINQYSR